MLFKVENFLTDQIIHNTFYTIQYNTIQYNTIQYNTIQYNTIQCNTIIADEVRSTESAIISSYPTSVCGIIVLLNTKHWIKYLDFFSIESSSRLFWGKTFRKKIVSFHIWTNYRI